MKNILTVSLLIVCFFSYTQADTIKLPQPQTTGGKPLMDALNERCSQRDFDEKREISEQTLSNLLWAANGVNRQESGKRTAPSAVNWQEIDIYVSLKKGTYKYIAVGHSLLRINEEDYRDDMGKQTFTAIAPLNLVFVADYSKMNGGSNTKEFYAATDCGFVSQNVYLFCASEGLATVVLGYIDRDKIQKALELNKDQHVVLSQTIGYPVAEFEESE